MKCSSNRFTLLLLALAMSLSGVATAEVPTISARFSQDSVEVGDIVEYIIDIDKDCVTDIALPVFGGNHTAKELEEQAKAKRQMSTYEEYDEDIFELVEEFPLDTIKAEGRRVHLRKRYLLAVMETGDIPVRPTISCDLVGKLGQGIRGLGRWRGKTITWQEKRGREPFLDVTLQQPSGSQ